jgi:hypothetical protein
MNEVTMKVELWYGRQEMQTVEKNPVVNTEMKLWMMGLRG